MRRLEKLKVNDDYDIYQGRNGFVVHHKPMDLWAILVVRDNKWYEHIEDILDTWYGELDEEPCG